MKRWVWRHVQDQSQEHIGGNLHLANGVDHGVARLAPEIEGEFAEDKVAVADGEHDAGDGKPPDQEVGCEGPCGVNCAVEGGMYGEENVNGIIEKGEEDLVVRALAASFWRAGQ